MLEINKLAPDFTLNDKDGNSVSLSDFKGKRVVLYFYPKDNTSGCSVQAQRYNELYEEFKENGDVVIGVSKDSEESHKKFASKYDLKFLLLSDPEHKVIELYDCWKEKNMYGKKVLGTKRTTYIINEEGIIIYANDKVKTASDADDSICVLKR